MSFSRILSFLPFGAAALGGCAQDLVHKDPQDLDVSVTAFQPTAQNDAGVEKENCRDGDGDGYYACNGPRYDCDDTNNRIHRDAPDPKYPNDRYDNDCDGETDEDVDIQGSDEFPANPNRPDRDAGFAPTDAACQDLDLDGFCVKDGDCDNSNRDVFLGAPELCDGLDNDCDGEIDEDFPVRFSNGDEDCDGIVEHHDGVICGEAVQPQEVVEWECRDGEVRACGTCDYGTQNCDDGHWQDCDFPELSQEEMVACGCHEVVERALNAGILFILDGSGSMGHDYGGGLTRYEAAGLAIDNILNNYWGRADFGFLRFPSDANCGVEPAQVPVGGNRADITRAYFDMQWGSTPLAGAIDEGTRALQNYQNNHPNNTLVAIILSDGGESCSGNPVVAINSMLNAGMQVYLVDASQENAVDDIARSINNPQRVYDASNPEQMNAAFDSILVDISINVPQREEICDGIDNNCNGLVDEGFRAFSYAGAVGTAGVGVCAIEERDCVEGAMQVINAGVNPSNEICDGRDNDCDGQTDECFRLNETCKPIDHNNACLYKARTGCSEDGASVVCEVPEPSPEICNGIDDDCNFVIDDVAGEICPELPAEGEGEGIGEGEVELPAIEPHFIQFTHPAIDPQINNQVISAINILPDDGDFVGNGSLTVSWLMDDQGEDFECDVSLKNKNNDEIASQTSVMGEFSASLFVDQQFKPLNLYTATVEECRDLQGRATRIDQSITFFTGDPTLAFGYGFFPEQGDHVLDVSGHGFDLALRGNPLPTWLPEGGMEFDGAQNVAIHNLDVPLGLDAERTISGLFKVTRNRLQNSFTVGQTVGPNQYRSFTQLHSDDGGLLALNYYGDDGTLTQPVSAHPVVVPNVWYHFAITTDGSSIRFYFNGHELDKVYPEGENVRPQADRAVGILLGAALGGGDPYRYFGGSIKAFGAHRGRKTEEEVLELCRNEAANALAPNENPCP